MRVESFKQFTHISTLEQRGHDTLIMNVMRGMVFACPNAIPRVKSMGIMLVYRIIGLKMCVTRFCFILKHDREYVVKSINFRMIVTSHS